MGWMPDIPHDPGPYPRGSQTPRQVVCHRTYGAWGGDYAVGQGSRTGIGFHFLVGKQEEQWVQFYDTHIRCNHAAGGNRDSVGIEVTGTDDDPMTDWQIQALARIVEWLRDVDGIPVEKWIGSRVDHFNGYRDHAQVAGSTHTDFWSRTDWAAIVAHIGGEENDLTDEQAQQLAAVFNAVGRIDAEGDGTHSAWSAWMQHLENIEAAVARIEARLGQ